MKRRTFLGGLATAAAGLALPELGVAAARPPLEEPHFPSRLYQFVWRNWELANLDRMAQVLQATEAKVGAIGRSLGLPEKPRLSSDQLRRIYITVIRQNWHLLPNEQIVTLLGWTPDRFEFALREDDFLDHKLGPKPDCQPVLYADPTPGEKRRATEIRNAIASTVREHSGPAEPAFAFVERLSRTGFEPLRNAAAVADPESVDISGWGVEASGPVDRRIADRLAEYLRAAMGSAVGTSGGKTVRLALEAGEKESFSVEVGEASVAVTGSNVPGLLQGVYWLQERMESAGGPFLPRGRTERTALLTPRYLYSYFALYGDPLLEPEIDPFPEGYLERLGRAGIGGVWMQAVLSTLAPSRVFPEFGHRSDERLANLDRFVQRAKRVGLKIYLYINEPGPSQRTSSASASTSGERALKNSTPCARRRRWYGGGSLTAWHMCSSGFRSSAAFSRSRCLRILPTATPNSGLKAVRVALSEPVGRLSAKCWKRFTQGYGGQARKPKSSPGIGAGLPKWRATSFQNSRQAPNCRA